MRFSATALGMFVFWFLLSGETGAILVCSGVIASVLVAYFSSDLLFGKEKNLKLETARYIRLFSYLPWLMWQIVISNIQLVYLTLHPRLLLDPVIVRFKSDLKTEMGLVTLANSITLTPGTVTIDITRDHEFIVHALTGEFAEGLLEGSMQRKASRIESGRSAS